MLKDEIHIPAECSSLQSLGLWFRLLLDISASTLHTIYIQCRRRRFYSAKKGRIVPALFCYCGRHFGEISVHLFTHVSRQFTNLYNTLCSLMVLFVFCCVSNFCAFLFKKKSALCALSSLFGEVTVGEGMMFVSSELRRPSCSDIVPMRIIAYICTLQIIT